MENEIVIDMRSGKGYSRPENTVTVLTDDGCFKCHNLIFRSFLPMSPTTQNPTIEFDVGYWEMFDSKNYDSAFIEDFSEIDKK